MRNVLDKNCRENENTQSVFNNFFSENRTICEMSMNTVQTEGPQMTSQYGAFSLGAGLVGLHARMRMHTPTRPDTHMHARTHAQVCTHRSICNTYNNIIQWFRERASKLCYTYIVRLVVKFYIRIW